jgi:Tfp pilus assembly protein PilF
VQNYPNSSDLYDILGEAYTGSGQKQLAIESYKRSTDKDPDNDHAMRKLMEPENGPEIPK